MSVFFSFVTQLLPIYLLVPLGYFLGQRLQVKKESIAPIVVYVLTTAVIFQAAYSTELSWQRFSLPLLFFGVICISSLFSYFLISPAYKQDSSEKRLLIFSSTATNIGYFGIPVTLTILGESAALLVALSVMGVALFQNTIGFYLISRGKYSAKESLLRTLRLPPIYGFLVGLGLNYFQVELSSQMLNLLDNFRGAYSVFGMMMIGIAFADVPKFVVQARMLTLSILSKFLVWPLTTLMLIWIDVNWLGWYDNLTHQVFLLLSAVPIGANVVAYASLLKVEPEKASILVLTSTIIAIFFLPLFIWVFL